MHAVEHYAIFVRQGVSECGCYSTDICVPRGHYKVVVDVDTKCKEIDKVRAMSDMRRVVAHFLQCVADVDRESTPDALRSPHALDLANVLAQRMLERIDATDTRAKKNAIFDSFNNPPKSRKRLFASTHSEPAPEPLPDITVQKLEWPPQPPPLVIE